MTATVHHLQVEKPVADERAAAAERRPLTARSPARQVAVVTGANSGLGKETARHFAQEGARVVFACRDMEGGQRALEQISGETGNSALELQRIDLGDFESVRNAARELAGRHRAIDVVVNNAGYLPRRREESDCGVDRSFAVNHLGPFLFTRELLPQLVRSRQARIVNVSSDIYRMVTVPFDDLAFERRFGPYYTYAVGKLGNVMFTHELHRRLSARGLRHVTVNALHPGYIASGFGRRSQWHIRLMVRAVAPLLTSAKRGAQTQIELATSPKWAEVSGSYVKGGRSVEATPYSRDPDHCRRLWEVSSALCGLED